MILTPQTPTVCPFTVLVDSREKAAYRFDGMPAGTPSKPRDLLVTTEWRFMQTGDYSIDGMEDRVVIERKSLADLYSTLGQHRERFEREHQRMAEVEWAAVIVEASWYEILKMPPERSKLNPKSVFGTFAAWQIRYGVPWFCMQDRRLSEICCFRLLEKFWKERRNDD